VKLNTVYFNAISADDFEWDNWGAFPSAGTESGGIHIVIGDSVMRIPSFIFFGNWDLGTPNILSLSFAGGSVCKVIGEGAFTEQYNITTLSLPSGLTHIGANAFAGTGVRELIIPQEVVEIGNGAFYCCESLTTVRLNNCSASIGDQAFEYCISLLSIDLGSGLTSIGSRSFGDCFFLSDVNLGNVTSIGEGAFANCNSIQSIWIPDTAASLGDSAFFQCEGLESVYIGRGITHIGNYAFYYCYKLTNLDWLVPNIVSIGDYAFSECYALTSVNIPDSVTEIGACAFYNCENLVDVTLGSRVSSIGDYAFAYTHIPSITLTNSITYIGSCVFCGCDMLDTIFLQGPDCLDWNNIEKASDWDYGMIEYSIGYISVIGPGTGGRPGGGSGGTIRIY
jgi:hypothetical protein